MERVLDEPVTRSEDGPAFEAAPSLARPSPTVGEAARRNWVLILVAAILFGGLGVAAGDRRDPVYTSTSTLSVGKNDLTVQSIPGFGVGAAAVAASLSRAVRAQEIVVPAARKLGVRPGELASHVFATTIPQSTLFTIGATAESPELAIQYANATAAEMVAYGRGNGSKRATLLLKRYQKVTAELTRSRTRLIRLRRSASSTSASAVTPAAGATSNSRTKAISRLGADIAGLELRQETTAAQYRDLQSQSQSGAIVQRITPALGAASDRNEKLQLFAGLGALAGLLVGLALAVIRTAWRLRRKPA